MTTDHNRRLSPQEHLERAEVATAQAEQQEDDYPYRAQVLAALATAHGVAGILRWLVTGGLL